MLEIFQVDITDEGFVIGDWKQFNSNGQIVFLKPREDGLVDYIEMYDDAKSIKETYTIKPEVSYYIEFFSIDIATLDYMFIKKVMSHTSYYQSGSVKSILLYDMDGSLLFPETYFYESGATKKIRNPNETIEYNEQHEIIAYQNAKINVVYNDTTLDIRNCPPPLDVSVPIASRFAFKYLQIKDRGQIYIYEYFDSGTLKEFVCLSGKDKTFYEWDSKGRINIFGQTNSSIHSAVFVTNDYNLNTQQIIKTQKGVKTHHTISTPSKYGKLGKTCFKIYD